MNMQYICKTCRIHTANTVKRLSNGRYQLICSECKTVSPTFDKHDVEITTEQLKQEKEDFR